jgi:hypothetical protein
MFLGIEVASIEPREKKKSASNIVKLCENNQKKKELAISCLSLLKYGAIRGNREMYYHLIQHER